MVRPIFIAFTVALFMANSAPALCRTLEVEIDLYKKFGEPVRDGSRGSVVIDSVVVNRSQPEDSGEVINVAPEYTDRQIGYVNHNGARFDILLKKRNIDELVREATALALGQAGFIVVEGQSQQADAPVHLDIVVDSLWAWANPIKGSSRSEMVFDIETTMTSNSEKLANIQKAQGHGTRNGSRPASASSYQTTIFHTMKIYIEDLDKEIRTSIGAAQNADARSANPASLTEALQELQTLLDAGAITDDEYGVLRQGALDSYLQ